jgi:hypothetical protein
MRTEPPRIFVLELRALPGTDAIRELKLILKQLLRRHGFRCLSVREKTGNQTRENEDG